jgi:hypothetical protein
MCLAESTLNRGILFPNENYRDVLRKMVDFFEVLPGVFAVVLTGSLARGKAVEGSCIDLCVFVNKGEYEKFASGLDARARAYSRMGGGVCYYADDIEGGIEFGEIRVDLNFADGKFRSGRMPYDMVRDEFETTIGNLLVYCVPLFQTGNKFQLLRSKYLPFYGDALRQDRLDGTNSEFHYKTWKTRWLASRGEYFSAFETLLETERIFIQHVFIKERKYPIDYAKWLKEQCATILAMPELYPKLAHVVDGIKLNKNEIMKKTALLEQLMQQYGT